MEHAHHAEGSDAPFFSVLMPAYNCQDSVYASVRSVLDETDVSLELVIADDASTDATPEILDAIAREDPRVKVIHRAQNGGDGPARNTAFEHVRGQWLVLLDSDDLFFPGILKKLEELCRATQADVVLTPSYSILMDRREFHDYTIGTYCRDFAGKGLLAPEEVSEDLFSSFGSGISNKVYRMERIRETQLRFQDNPRVGDLYFTMGAMALARSLEIVDWPYYLIIANYRVSLSSHAWSSGMDFYSAAMALHDLMVEKGVWDFWKEGYWGFMIAHLGRTLIDPDSRELRRPFLKKMQDEGFERIDLKDAQYNKDQFGSIHYERVMHFMNTGELLPESHVTKAPEPPEPPKPHYPLYYRAYKKVLNTGKAAFRRLYDRFVPPEPDNSAQKTPSAPELLLGAQQGTSPEVTLVLALGSTPLELEESFESIAFQVFTNYELLVLDNGQSAELSAMAAEHAENDERIRIVSSACDAASAALAHARGDQLAFVGPGDSLYPCYLSALLGAVQATDAPIALCAAQEFAEKPKPYPERAFEGIVLEDGEAALAACGAPPANAALFAKSAVAACKGDLTGAIRSCAAVVATGGRLYGMRAHAGTADSAQESGAPEGPANER